MYDRVIDAVCRWLCFAFPKRCRLIPQEDDSSRTKLIQFMIMHGVYLQHFETPEQYKYFHDHRWARMRSFVLSGTFCEERQDGHLRYHQRFETYTMDDTVRHRVDWWGTYCWTLFIMREDVHPWGYYHRITKKFTPWNVHIRDGLRVPNLETGKVTGHD